MFDYEYWGLNNFDISKNMALEELMLDESAKRKIAGIRFWNVNKDSAVLGYGEDVSGIKKRDASFDLARRITGGSHVEFDNSCLAYTFTVPRDGSFRHYEDMRKYFAEYVTQALVNLGLDDAYADNKASTINVNGKVIASHALFWGVESALLHGLILIDHYNVDKIAERMLLSKRQIGKKIYSEADALRQAPVVSELIDAPYTIDKASKFEYAKKAIEREVLSLLTKGRHSKILINDKTLERANKLVQSTHTDSRWLDTRNPPYTKEAVEAIPGEELNGTLKKGLGYCMYIEVDDNNFKEMSIPENE
jgi:lipoate-protein ligase A